FPPGRPPAPPGRKPGVHPGAPRDPPQRRRRIERERGIEPLPGAALLHHRVTPGAVARVHLRVMRLVTQDAVLGDRHVVLAYVERIAPVGVTLGRRARLRRLGGLLLDVRVVAEPARAPMRVARRVEVREDRLHLMAREALLE